MYQVARIVVAVLFLVLSLPMVPLVCNAGFTLAAALTVPTVVFGILLSVLARQRVTRIGWFVFSAVVAMSLAIGPWWKIVILDLLAAIQNHVPHSMYRILEPSSIVALPVIPWLTACLVGKLAARLATRRLRIAVDEGNNVGSFQFSICDMLCGFVIIALVVATLTSSVERWNSHARSHRSRFLSRFTGSFDSGRVQLIGNPEISMERRNMIQTPGVHEYRIVAPIRKDGKELWAVWTYTAYEHVPDSVGQYGYAEAETLDELPPSPAPWPEHLGEPIVHMTDGEPHFKWPKPEIIECSDRLRPNGTIVVVAKAEWGAECEMRVSPFHAVVPPPPAIKTAPQKKPMRWEWKLDPKFQGQQVEIEILSRLNSVHRASSVKRTIEIDR